MTAASASPAATLIIGLTGGIGAGKSTVAALLAERGAEVVDVDALGREVLDPGGPAFEPVLAAFGPDVLGADGLIDRAALGAAVFGPAGRLAELEAISHPAINARLTDVLAASTADLVVLDMAVLAESRLGYSDGAPLYQRVVVVEADLQSRLDRLADRGLSAPQATARIRSQADDAQRRLLADLVVVNNDDLLVLAHKVEEFWPTIKAWQTQTGER